MSIAEKLTTIAENEQKVYDAGKQVGEGVFWDNYQNNGKRTNYSYAFYMWPMSAFKPKYDLKPTNGTYMFRNITDEVSLVDLLEQAGVVLDTSNCSNFSYMFYMSSFTEIPHIVIAKTTSLSSFIYNCNNLTKLEITFGEGCVSSFSTSTIRSTSLVDLTVHGVIDRTGLNLSYCTALSHDSLMSVINALKNYSGSGTTYTLTLGTTHLAQLTTAEKAIATNKGWTLA